MVGKHLIRGFVVLIAVLVIGSVVLLWIANAANESSTTIPDEGAVFSVEKGEHLDSIADRLLREGYIRSKLFIKAFSFLRRTQASFQTGSYRIDPGMSTLDIHDVLVSGREILVRVTIPEGWTASQIAGRFDEFNIVASESFLRIAEGTEITARYGLTDKSAEGFLFPDTYMFPKNYPAEKVVEVMVKTFFEQLEEVYPEHTELDESVLYDRIVIASIIEREYRADDEASLMASVFINRLEADMRLQSCATVAYVMTEELGLEYPEVLTYDDLNIQSEYNTYRNGGLPPGPISNPGATALSAAFHPAKSDYYYFVLKDPDAGRHEFTKSFDEHLSAKNLYLKKS